MKDKSIRKTVFCLVSINPAFLLFTPRRSEGATGVEVTVLNVWLETGGRKKLHGGRPPPLISISLPVHRGLKSSQHFYFFQLYRVMPNDTDASYGSSL